MLKVMGRYHIIKSPQTISRDKISEIARGSDKVHRFDTWNEVIRYLWILPGSLLQRTQIEYVKRQAPITVSLRGERVEPGRYLNPHASWLYEPGYFGAPIHEDDFLYHGDDRCSDASTMDTAGLILLIVQGASQRSWRSCLESPGS
jgi:hypothetical protein